MNLFKLNVRVENDIQGTLYIQNVRLILKLIKYQIDQLERDEKTQRISIFGSNFNS